MIDLSLIRNFENWTCETWTFIDDATDMEWHIYWTLGGYEWEGNSLTGLDENVALEPGNWKRPKDACEAFNTWYIAKYYNGLVPPAPEMTIGEMQVALYRAVVANKVTIDDIQKFLADHN